MIAVDTFIKLLKISRIELDFKSYKHCRTFPHPLFTQDDDLYENDSCDEVCECCIEKNVIDENSRGRKKGKNV